MRRMLSVISLLLTSSTVMAAQERNMRLTGDGEGDGYMQSGGSGRRDIREVRLTLRPNNQFAATIFTDAGEYAVKGLWLRRGLDNVERIQISEAFGTRASGDGTLEFGDRDHLRPQRLSLSGNARDGRFSVEISDRDHVGDGRPKDRPDDGGNFGSGSSVFRNIDAGSRGEGRTQMSGIKGDGRFSVVRARIGTGQDVVIDIDKPTRGIIKGTVRAVRGNRIELDARSIYGFAGSGAMTVVLRNDREVSRIEGSGNSQNGRWTIEYRSTASPGDDWGGGGNDRPPMDRTERGDGSLSQDRGPTLDFDRATVRLSENHRSEIRLEGLRETVRIYGRWDQGALGRVTIDVDRINERRSDGRLELRRDGRQFRSIEGDGRTDGGRYRLSFRSK